MVFLKFWAKGYNFMLSFFIKEREKEAKRERKNKMN